MLIIHLRCYNIIESTIRIEAKFLKIKGRKVVYCFASTINVTNDVSNKYYQNSQALILPLLGEWVFRENALNDI